MKAYVAVQKKLLTLCFAIWNNDAKYDPLYYAARAAPQQCQRTKRKEQKNSPDQQDYTGCSRLKLLLLLSPKNIKKILSLRRTVSKFVFQDSNNGPRDCKPQT